MNELVLCSFTLCCFFQVLLQRALGRLLGCARAARACAHACSPGRSLCVVVVVVVVLLLLCCCCCRRRRRRGRQRTGNGASQSSRGARRAVNLYNANCHALKLIYQVPANNSKEMQPLFAFILTKKGGPSFGMATPSFARCWVPPQHP